MYLSSQGQADVYVEGVDRNRDGPDILQQAPYLATSCRVSAKTGDLSLNIAIFHRMGPLDLGEVRSKFSDNPQDFWVSLLLGRSLCSCWLPKRRLPAAMDSQEPCHRPHTKLQTGGLEFTKRARKCCSTFARFTQHFTIQYGHSKLGLHIFRMQACSWCMTLSFRWLFCQTCCLLPWFTPALINSSDVLSQRVLVRAHAEICQICLQYLEIFHSFPSFSIVSHRFP